jgi:conjugative relaxase-like TrwC/TraI family protein
VLSIAPMGARSAGYYSTLAREDYYLKGGEPLGLWEGRGAEHLGLQGTVQEQAFRNLFAGFSPDKSQKLVQNAGGDRHPGWDLTFSAPKSVSVLWSQVSPAARAQIESAVIDSTRDALRYVEQTAVFTRRGRGGTIIEKGEGMVSALFLHGTSRSQDPQLHVHALVLNVVPRADGSWGAMLGITSSERSQDRTRSRSALFAEKMTAGALFRASLASRLVDLGVEVERTKQGFEVGGVPKDLITRFSTRSQEIAEELRALGGSSARDKERAALLSRERKARLSREELFRKWKEVGRGFELENLIGRTPGQVVEPSLAEAIERATARMEKTRPEFSQSDFLRTVAEESIGCRHRAQHLQLAAERQLIAFPKASDTSDLFTTPATARAQAALAPRLESMSRRRGVGRIASRHLKPHEESLERQGQPLSPASRVAIRALVGARNRLRVLTGLTSKESLGTMEVARKAWEAQGYKVVGVSPTVRRARAVQAMTGISTHTPSSLKEAQQPRGHLEAIKATRKAGIERIRFGSLTNLISYAGKVKRTPRVTVDRETVLVIDSPGMMDPTELRQMVSEANRNGATVVFTNNPQSQSSQLGAVMSRLASGNGALE